MVSGHRHSHKGDHPGSHSHTHGVVDPAVMSSDRGIWAIKWSFSVLMLTALLQVLVVWLSGSVALLADTIHNFGDAATALPLWIAFKLVSIKPNRRFSYGYGRVEDLAGVVIVFIILFSAVIAGYESINRLIHPQNVEHLWAVITASIVGFGGNEAVALFRIKVGKEIGSAALVADGYHARVDGWTSLAVLFGALGIWLGYPLSDPIVGLLITAAILWIVWKAGKSVFSRLLDGVDPEIIQEARGAANQVSEVREVTEVRVRWIGHRLHAEVNIAVESELTVAQGHEIANKVQSQLLNHLGYLSNATIHVDPVDASGEKHHNIAGQTRNDLTSRAQKP